MKVSSTKRTGRKAPTPKRGQGSGHSAGARRPVLEHRQGDRKPTLESVELHEDVRTRTKLAVDREKGVIRDVKILGLESVNKRRYTPEAARRAQALYEGIHVNIDHPPKKDGPNASRSSYDRFGKLVNVRFKDGEGLFGDLEYLKAHPMAERIVEAAERMPDIFGLSHNAQGEGKNENGVFIIEQITEVRHVDLVADPATTQSLFESREGRTVAKTKKQQSLKSKKHLKPLTEEQVISRLLLLREMDDEESGYGVMGDVPDEPAEGGMDNYEDHAGAMAAAIVCDPDLDTAGKMAKIKALLNVVDKGEKEDEAEEEEDDEETPEAADDEEEEEEDDEKKKKDAKESRKPKKPAKGQKQLQESCEAMCRLAGVEAKADLLEDLMDLGTDALRLRMLERIKAAKPTGQKPKSQSPNGQSVTEGRGGDSPAPKIPEKSEDLANWLRN